MESSVGSGDKNHKMMEELILSAKALRGEIPEVYKGFSDLSKAAMADGAIPATLKEALAIAISVINRCDGCIGSHARAAAIKGTTKEEVAEAIGVAILLVLGVVFRRGNSCAEFDFQSAQVRGSLSPQ